MKTLIIDNYDSYTYNLFQLISDVNGEEAVVVRNDAASWEELSRLGFDNVVLSPGPGTPGRREDFGICADALATPGLPILGVCLGHQGLAEVNGGAVARTPGAVHGRISPVLHDGSPLFAGIPQGFGAVRYHSLSVDRLPASVRRTAWTAGGTVMGLAHRERPHWGVQFHPESICTEHGRRLLENFRDLSASRSHARPTPPARRRRPARRPRPAPGAPRVFWRRIDRLVDPEAAFVGLYGARRYAYWLDSSLVSDGMSRFSYMGASGGPLSRIVSYDAERRRVVAREGSSMRTHAESIFGYLERELASLACAADELPFEFTGGFVGYFGYEVKADCGSPLRHRSPWPDAQFILADRIVAFDHLERRTYAVCLAHSEADARPWLERTVRRLETLGPASAPTASAPAEFTPWRERSRYLAEIAACQEEIAAGQSYEICLTNELRSAVQVDPLAVYRELRRRSPAPHAAYLRFGRMSVLSSSPERFLHIDRDGRIEAKPIKGTAPRGATAEADRRLRDALATGEKTRAENLMIVDLLRNDLGAVSEIGSVGVPKLMQVETYRTLHQLVSTVRARRREDVSPVECIRAAFPPGSMTGAPKLRTMDILDRLEGRPRGVYSGAIGFLGLNDTVDLSVVIRTLVTGPAGSSIGIGGAIVAQSDAEEEHAETRLKARALLDAVAAAAAPRSVEAILASGYAVPPGECAPRTLSAVAWRG